MTRVLYKPEREYLQSKISTLEERVRDLEELLSGAERVWKKSTTQVEQAESRLKRLVEGVDIFLNGSMNTY